MPNFMRDPDEFQRAPMMDQITRLLTTCGAPHLEHVMPPTQLFNEGWLLRLALDWFASSKTQGFPLSVHRGGRWYSEALLRSQFFAASRTDILAESWTHADAVIGHFAIGAEDGGGEALLDAAAEQFVVVEAKLMSPLSPGTKRAPSFDQAARNVACIANVLSRAKRQPDQIATLAFYVVAPETKIKEGLFGNLLEHDSIREKVRARVGSYRDREIQPDAVSMTRQQWFESWFEPTMRQIKIDVIP